MRRRPSPFFIVSLPAFALGLIAALSAGDAEPAFALKSNLVFRAEVGAAVFGLLYAVTLLLFLVWHGRAPQQLGGGPATMQTTPQIVDGGQELGVTMPDRDTSVDPEQGQPNERAEQEQ